MSRQRGPRAPARATRRRDGPPTRDATPRRRFNNGDGVDENQAIAFTWWRNAAAAGDADAMSNLIPLMDSENPAEAAEGHRWAELAAAQGVPYAINVLGGRTAATPDMVAFAQMSLEEMAARAPAPSGTELAWSAEEIRGSLAQVNDLVGWWLERLRTVWTDVTHTGLSLIVITATITITSTMPRSATRAARSRWRRPGRLRPPSVSITTLSVPISQEGTASGGQWTDLRCTAQMRELGTRRPLGSRALREADVLEVFGETVDALERRRDPVRHLRALVDRLHQALDVRLVGVGR